MSRPARFPSKVSPLVNQTTPGDDTISAAPGEWNSVHSLSFRLRVRSNKLPLNADRLSVVSDSFCVLYLKDKWKLRQEEMRLKTAQENISREKEAMLEHVKRERADVQRAKVRMHPQRATYVYQRPFISLEHRLPVWSLRQSRFQGTINGELSCLTRIFHRNFVGLFVRCVCFWQEQLLDEQKSILAQLYEERRALADERAQFNLSQKLKMEQDQRESLKQIKAIVSFLVPSFVSSCEIGMQKKDVIVCVCLL